MIDLNERPPQPAESGRAAELRDAIEVMFFGYRAFTDRADQILGEHGLGRVHHRILYFVGRNPGVSVKGLLDILTVSKQAINAPLRELADQGLVGMAADPSDRRMKKLSLTAKGAALEAALTGVQMEHLMEAFGTCGPRAQAGWSAVMHALAGR